MARRVAGRLTDSERARRDGEHNTRVEDQYTQLGVSAETLDRSRSALRDRGVTDSERVLGVMLRVIHELREEGEAFELDPAIQRYMENDLRLTGEQIEFVVGLSRRVLGSIGNSGRDGQG